MKLTIIAMLLVLALPEAPALARQAKTGTIVGRVRMTGRIPKNPRIRMGADPKCSALYRGKTAPVQPIFAVGEGNGLGNVFVNLEGKFPATPVPKTPVVIDQHGCMFTPRVVGARVGQTLQIKNSDGTSHNAHGVTEHGNTFDFSQPKTGMTSTVALKNAERMLRVRCDIHSWMTAYVGVVDNPYFDVSGTDGTFRIENVPPGRYTIRAWHEAFGPQTATVVVKAGETATMDFTYPAAKKG